MGITVHEVPVQSRGSQTAILLALRPYSHSAHPRPMPWGQPMESLPGQGQAQREGPAPQGGATRGGSPALHPGALPTGRPTALECGFKHRQRFLTTTIYSREKQNSETNAAGALGTRLPRLEPMCPWSWTWRPAPSLSGEEALPQPAAKPRPPLHPGPPLGRPHFTGTALPFLRLLCLHRAGQRWAPGG